MHDNPILHGRVAIAIISARYHAIGSEAENLPNKLALTDTLEIQAAETVGFFKAAYLFTQQLAPSTAFTCGYICQLHQAALGFLYAFAGRYRRVNISKGGFLFPPAQFLAEGMSDMETRLLRSFNQIQGTHSLVVDAIAAVHAELLFLHPFREGNGRTARLLADLMLRQKTGHTFHFGSLAHEGPIRQRYYQAVRQAAGADYRLMQELSQTLPLLG